MRRTRFRGCRRVSHQVVSGTSIGVWLHGSKVSVWYVFGWRLVLMPLPDHTHQHAANVRMECTREDRMSHMARHKSLQPLGESRHKTTCAPGILSVPKFCFGSTARK